MSQYNYIAVGQEEEDDNNIVIVGIEQFSIFFLIIDFKNTTLYWYNLLYILVRHINKTKVSCLYIYIINDN